MTSAFSDVNNGEDDDGLNEIIESYKMLLDSQKDERELLFSKIDLISENAKNVDKIDEKMDNLTNLLKEINRRIEEIKPLNGSLEVSEDHLPSSAELLAIEEKINYQSEKFSNKIQQLEIDIQTKKNEIKEKDEFINELNEQLELLALEKTQLLNRVEELHSQSSKTNEQIELLQKLASSDPRYKAIDTLKKHGSLSEIQLAFSMGTSISQVSRYAEDLVKLKLIRRDNTGRFVWMGEE